MEVLVGELDGLRVVVAEDDFLIAHHIEEVLCEQGASTTVVNSVRELLAMDLSTADVAILDRSLVDGDVLMGAERLAKAGIPLIYQSGYNAEGADTPQGAIGVLTKPVDEARLVRLLAGVKAHAA